MSTTLSTDELLLDLLNESVEVLLEFQHESASMNNLHGNALLLDIDSGDMEDLSDDDEPHLINQQTNLHLQPLKDDHDENQCIYAWTCSDIKKTDEFIELPIHSLPPLHENIITETTNNEVVYLRTTSKSSNEDRIGDLGNLSDFTDQDDNSDISQSHPKTANDEIIFVAIEDKSAYNTHTHLTSKSNSNFIDHDIDLQRSIFNILHNTDMDSSDHNAYDTKLDSDDTTYTYTHRADMDMEHTLTNNKVLSQLRPDTFDICLLTTAPLSIEGSHYNDECLEYLHHSLPNTYEIQEMVYDKLMDSELHLRYAHFSLTKANLHSVVSLGGCKVLQVVALCCNPALDMDIWPRLCQLCPYSDDNNYVLLQMSEYGESKWYDTREIYDIINVLTVSIDIIICISPQHKRMVSIFKTFGFNYIIGVEAPMDYYTFAQTEQHTFLSHLYYGLLNKGSVAHCFYLSLQAANPDSDHSKYILEVAKKHELQRYVVFNDLEYGEIVNLSTKPLPGNTNLVEIIRPFIGRSQSVIKLLHQLKSNQNKIINITGRELIGKSTLIKYVIRYLSENGLFSGGCFVIDCKAKKYKNAKMTFSQAIYDAVRSCNCELNLKAENNADALLDAIQRPFCFIVLNINHWYNGNRVITKWIANYAHKLFKNSNSRIICTNNKTLHVSPSISVSNMSELTDLNRNELAMVFKYFCGDISNFNLTLKDIEEHDALQSVFNGSPGITQKVAQFVMLTNHGNDNKQISLDQIARDYKGTKPRPMYLKCSISAPPNGRLLTNSNLNVQHLELDRSMSLMLRPSELNEDTEDPYALISDPSLPPSPQQNVTYRSMPKSHSVEKIMQSSIATRTQQLPRNLNQSLELQIHSNHILLFSDINDTDFLAKQVWNICTNNYESSVTLNDLYPHLMGIFQRLTDNKCARQPQISEISPFFIKIGGVYNEQKVLYISQDKFYRFFMWFHSMCNMIKDLDLVYNQHHKCGKPDGYMSIFYSRDTAKQHIKKQIEGTFVFRVASQANGLAITFKKANGKISNILLKRLSDRIYTVGKTQKKTNLFQLISSCAKLKYLYICDTYQIAKELIFNPNNNNIPSLTMPQSFTQHTHSDIYADIDAKMDGNLNDIDLIPGLGIEEIVRNFSTIYPIASDGDQRNDPKYELKLKHENEGLKKENMDLKKEMERIKNENERLKQLLLCRYNNTPTSTANTPTPTSISSFSSSESISAVTPSESAVVPFQQKQFWQTITKYPYDFNLLPFKPQ